MRRVRITGKGKDMNQMQMHPDEALERLLEGNRRYAAAQQIRPNQTTFHREALVVGQEPFAAILSCSDSRVPSELIFDQGLGDLFIVRTAGHTVNGMVLASLEYAVYALNVPLIVVVGHQHCGAVSAVMQGLALPGHMAQLAETLWPALRRIDRAADDGVEQAICANARYTADGLGTGSSVLCEALENRQVRIIPAYYNLETALVSLLE